MNSGRNPEYREVRSGKKSEMRIFKIYGTRPSFSIFSVNNRGGTLIFGMDVEIGFVLKNKLEKKSTPKYQTRPGAPEGGNRNAEHSLRTENKMMRKFTKLITGL